MIDESGIQLTQYAHGAGCGCKMAPAVLEAVLNGLKAGSDFPGLLVGNESDDDAAVYELDNGQCLISTTDFFTPIVDDAFTFGKIAACNAISDVYAMGGTPLMALAVLGYPVEKLPVSAAREIISGGKSICAEAGIPLAGGHSIDSTEPFFGLAVTGILTKEQIRRNNTAQVGDLIFLTKKTGTGILTTALKRKLIATGDLDDAVKSMCTLNRAGRVFSRHPFVHAMTDVTGFGILGHLLEMCKGSGLSASIEYESIGLIKGAAALAKKYVAPDNTFRLWKRYEPEVAGVLGERMVTLCDPQTNGGLIVAVDPIHEEAFRSLLDEQGLSEYKRPIGRFAAQDEKWITVT